MIDIIDLKRLIQKLPTPNGFRAGLPMKLTKWQNQILDDIFIPEEKPEIIYIEIPRKNGKTTFIAALLVSLFNLDPEPGAEFYCASGDKEQAGIIYNIADYMIKSSSALSKRIRTVPSQKKFVRRNESTRFFRSLSSDAHSKHGYNPYFTIFDELHVFKTRELWDVMDTGDIARDNPLKIIITTAGNDMTTLCGEFHEHAIDVMSGKIQDEKFKPYIFTVEDKDKWQDEAQWIIANPSIQEGILKIDKIRQKYKRALGKPMAEAAFKRLHLNIWQEQKYEWVPIEKYDQCADKNFNDNMLIGGIAGLDLGFGQDTTSLCLLNRKGMHYFYKTFTWITHSEAARMEKMYGIPYPQWIREGLIRTYGIDIPDYEILERDINKILNQYHIKFCGYDRWKSHTLIGKINTEMAPIGQGFKSMTMPIKVFENLLYSGKVSHPGSPVFREAYKNIYIKEDAAGNAKPDKQKSYHKIDPISALLIALSVIETKEPPKPSMYEPQMQGDR